MSPRAPRLRAAASPSSPAPAAPRTYREGGNGATKLQAITPSNPFKPPPLEEMWAQISDEPFPEQGTPAFSALSQLYHEEYRRLRSTPEYKAAVQEEYERLQGLIEERRRQGLPTLGAPPAEG